MQLSAAAFPAVRSSSVVVPTFASCPLMVRLTPLRTLAFSTRASPAGHISAPSETPFGAVRNAKPTLRMLALANRGHAPALPKFSRLLPVRPAALPFSRVPTAPLHQSQSASHVPAPLR